MSFPVPRHWALHCPEKEAGWRRVRRSGRSEALPVPSRERTGRDGGRHAAHKCRSCDAPHDPDRTLRRARRLRRGGALHDTRVPARLRPVGRCRALAGCGRLGVALLAGARAAAGTAPPRLVRLPTLRACRRPRRPPGLVAEIRSLRLDAHCRGQRAAVAQGLKPDPALRNEAPPGPSRERTGRDGGPHATHKFEPGDGPHDPGRTLRRARRLRRGGALHDTRVPARRRPVGRRRALADGRRTFLAGARAAAGIARSRLERIRPLRDDGQHGMRRCRD